VALLASPPQSASRSHGAVHTPQMQARSSGQVLSQLARKWVSLSSAPSLSVWLVLQADVPASAQAAARQTSNPCIALRIVRSPCNTLAC
jgi:hypothetical protein